METLAMRSAYSWRDFLAARMVRNDCRCYMTRDQYHISTPRQLLFFLKYHTLDNSHVMFIGEVRPGHPIAYGLISYDDHLQPWISGGLLSRYRGKGYGSQLFKFLSEGWHMPVHLEVLESNIRAHKLYTSLGFLETAREARILGAGRVQDHAETVITMRKSE